MKIKILPKKAWRLGALALIAFAGYAFPIGAAGDVLAQPIIKMRVASCNVQGTFLTRNNTRRHFNHADRVKPVNAGHINTHYPDDHQPAFLRGTRIPVTDQIARQNYLESPIDSYVHNFVSWCFFVVAYNSNNTAIAAVPEGIDVNVSVALPAGNGNNIGANDFVFSRLGTFDVNIPKGYAGAQVAKFITKQTPVGGYLNGRVQARVSTGTGYRLSGSAGDNTDEVEFRSRQPEGFEILFTRDRNPLNTDDEITLIQGEHDAYIVNTNMPPRGTVYIRVRAHSSKSDDLNTVSNLVDLYCQTYDEFISGSRLNSQKCGGGDQRITLDGSNWSIGQMVTVVSKADQVGGAYIRHTLDARDTGTTGVSVPQNIVVRVSAPASNSDQGGQDSEPEDGQDDQVEDRDGQDSEPQDDQGDQVEDQGDQGSQDDQGDQGSQGDQGDQGSQGDQGDQGDQGNTPVPPSPPTPPATPSQPATPTSIESVGGEIPDAFALEQNYPNPFNPSTTIEYALARASHVTLSVYDLHGRRIRTLANGVQAAGRYRTSFDGAGLASGTYLYVLRTEEHVSVKRMSLLK